MKIFIKLLILIIIVACAAPFFIKGPDGNRLFKMDIGTLNHDFFSQNTRHKALKNTDLKVFKWVDNKGVTHYSDQNDPQYNSQLSEIKPISTLSFQKQKKVEQPGKSEFSVGLTTVPLSKIPKLIDDSKQLKKVMEGRGRQIEQALK